MEVKFLHPKNSSIFSAEVAPGLTVRQALSALHSPETGPFLPTLLGGREILVLHRTNQLLFLDMTMAEAKVVDGDILAVVYEGDNPADRVFPGTRSDLRDLFVYYTCFISYSSQDIVFVRRLYIDLKQVGVRCWFAPEDMKIGDKIKHRLDESIRVHDKLLLILSKHAIMSNWVEKEVETALEIEQQLNKLVLFPISLDESVMQTSQAWAADLRRMRHIGDFTKWEYTKAYQKSFDKLLRDLRKAA